jgi:hypothetical protein
MTPHDSLLADAIAAHADRQGRLGVLGDAAAHDEGGIVTTAKALQLLLAATEQDASLIIRLCEEVTR